MNDFMYFLRLCWRYTSLYHTVWRSASGYIDDSGPLAKVFEEVYSGMMRAENDVFVFAAIHGVYPPFDQDIALKTIREAFIIMAPTIVSCEIVPPHLGTGPVLPNQVAYQATVVGTMSDGATTVVLRYFSDELSFSPNEFIGLTLLEASELFHKKDVDYLRS